MRLFKDLPLVPKLAGSIVLAAVLGGAITTAGGHGLQLLHGSEATAGCLWLAAAALSVLVPAALAVSLVRCIVSPLDEVRHAAQELARVDLATLAGGMTALA